MTALLACIALLYLLFLLWEAHGVRRARRQIPHVVHVNGTRGKSTVSRLIEAGLRAGGLRVFCKTTGTDPMVIDVAGRELPLRRRGRANIKEQIRILHRAAREQAQVLVVECMAITPEYQRAAQQDILKADVGVITNVRWDHTDVMGDTLPQIAVSLCSTVPRRGILFTAEEEMAPILEREAEKLGSPVVRTKAQGDEGDFDFPENIALALAVCQHLGVPRRTAIEGMRAFRRDPYALSLHRLHGAVFINGLSINDRQSICRVWEELRDRHPWDDRELVLLVNNRGDRASRTRDMLWVCQQLRPGQVWLMGASRGYMRRKLNRTLPGTAVRALRRADEMPREVNGTQVIFAIGNLAGEGRSLMEQVRKEGEPLV